METLVKFIQDEFVEKKEFPKFNAGDSITVYYEIKEGQKTRTQFFKGTVIQRRGTGASETFTIRKMSGTIGVERIFPINLPAIQKIEVNKHGRVRRARIFYFRGLTGKKARIAEKRRQSYFNKKYKTRFKIETGFLLLTNVDKSSLYLVDIKTIINLLNQNLHA